MHRYVIKRLLLLIPVIIGVSLFIFVSMDMASGDVTDSLGGEDMTEEQLHELRERLGLNDPVLVRYARYMWGLLHGDLGKSMITGTPVMDMYRQKLHEAGNGNHHHCCIPVASFGHFCRQTPRQPCG